MTDKVYKTWQTGSIRRTTGIKVEAMVICAEVDGSGYSLVMRDTDGTEHEFDFRPDLAKALAEGLAATLLEYGGLKVTPRTTRH